MTDKKPKSRCDFCTVPVEVRRNTHCCERCTKDNSQSEEVKGFAGVLEQELSLPKEFPLRNHDNLEKVRQKKCFGKNRCWSNVRARCPLAQECAMINWISWCSDCKRNMS